MRLTVSKLRGRFRTIMGAFGEWFCIGWLEKVALRVSEKPSLKGFFYRRQESLESPCFSSILPCGNDMIDAHVENLMDSKAVHRFTTVAWKSLRLSHNHLDNCFAVTHIPTGPTTTNLISQKN